MKILAFIPLLIAIFGGMDLLNGKSIAWVKNIIVAILCVGTVIWFDNR